MSEDFETAAGFTPEESAAWAVMSGNTAPATGATGDDDAEDDDLELAAEDAGEAQEPAEEQPAKPGPPPSVLRMEREARRKAEQRAAEVEKALAVQNERWQMLQRLAEQQAQQAQPEPVDDDPEPDPNTDIFAHSAWMKRQLQRTQETIAEQQRAAMEQQQMAAAEQQVWSAWDADVAAYSAQQADFGEAAKFLSGMRDRALKAAAIVDPRLSDAGARAAMIDQELAQIVIAAKQSGQNAAAVIYGIAKEYGYTGAPAALAAPAAPAVSEKLARVQQAQAASKSLSQASGTAGGGPLTVEQIANMSTDEFNDWYAKPQNVKAFKKMMSGG